MYEPCPLPALEIPMDQSARNLIPSCDHNLAIYITLRPEIFSRI
jgi:hypothetical protein